MENEYENDITEMRDQIAAEQVAELAHARSVVEKMKRLLENSDYRFLKEQINKQIEARMHRVLVRPEGVDDEVKNVYDRGEAAGLKIAAHFAQILLDGAEGTIAMMSKYEKDED